MEVANLATSQRQQRIGLMCCRHSGKCLSTQKCAEELKALSIIRWVL